MLIKWILTWLFIKSINPRIKIYKADSNYFDQNDSSIHICLCNEFNPGFKRHLCQEHKFISADNYSQYFLSLLHEAGHYYTEEHDDMDWLLRFYLGTINPDKFDEYCQDEYFNLPSEWNATEWAIDYIENHYAKSTLFNFIFSLFKK